MAGFFALAVALLPGCDARAEEDAQADSWPEARNWTVRDVEMSFDHMVGELASLDSSITVRYSCGFGIGAEVEPDSPGVIAWEDSALYARQEQGHVAITLMRPGFPQNWQVAGLETAGVGAALGLIREHSEMFHALLEAEAMREGVY